MSDMLYPYVSDIGHSMMVLTFFCGLTKTVLVVPEQGHYIFCYSYYSLLKHYILFNKSFEHLYSFQQHKILSGLCSFDLDTLSKDSYEIFITYFYSDIIHQF